MNHIRGKSVENDIKTDAFIYIDVHQNTSVSLIKSQIMPCLCEYAPVLIWVPV